jgi:hypothetical protein
LAKSAAKNQHRTFWVIVVFVLLYLSLGFVIDLVLYGSNPLPDANAYSLTSLGLTAKQLLTFQIVPIATLICGLVAIIALIITFACHNKMMLLGTEYIEVTANSTKLEEKQLYNVVEEMKVAAALRYIPRVLLLKLII